MLHSRDDVSAMIRSGQRLFLAGDESSLMSLPDGDWIGGTIPYFMTSEGGQATREALFVTPLPAELSSAWIADYSAETLPSLLQEAPENGYTLLLLPAESPAHLEYAHHAPDYPEMFHKPIVGWVSGVHLEDLGMRKAKVVDGRTLTAHDERALAYHCALPEGLLAQIGIVNLFKPGQGDLITFPKDGFLVEKCWINGEERIFAEYLTHQQADTRLPLVADYCGAFVNVSIQSVNQSQGSVHLYAPVFEGVGYRLAAPVQDYVADFLSAVPSDLEPLFSCNCILNYLYSSLEGKITSGLYGPMTFGEIAYQLLNQTLVYLKLVRS